MEKNQHHNVVCFGEILWDILPSGPMPGGAPMNVAWHLNRLEVNPALITRIGMDQKGKDLVKLFDEAGISTSSFQMDDEYPTGVVHAKPNEYNEVEYDIVFPSAWDFIEYNSDMGPLLQQAEYFVFGSLTSRNIVSRDTLYSLLEKAGTKVLDINLRPPHFNRNHVEYLLNKADILKMNIAELELITGWFGQHKSTADRISLLQDQFNIDTIIVTMGGEGAMVNHMGQLYQHPGYSVTVADTIGSGDAFLAGFLSQRLQGLTILETLDFASGMGAFVASRSGACPVYHPLQIKQLIQAHKTKYSTLQL